MKKLLVNNIGLKVVAVIIAVIVWMIIINVNDPSERKTINNIVVNIKNTEIFTDKGYIYSIKDNTDVISIVVKGPRTVVEKLKASDFTATATIANEFANSAKIEVKCDEDVKGPGVSISPTVTEVKFDVQNLVTKTFDVEVEFKGDPAKGYYTDVSLAKISPSSIRVSGPENVVERIASVKMVYDITGENTSFTSNVTPTLLDEAGNKITDSRLVFSKDNLSVKVEMYRTKEIPVKYAYTGTVKEGYKIVSLSSNIETIKVAGTDVDLAKVSSIDIPASLIDVTDLTSSKTVDINVSQYVPTNLICIDNEADAEVVVDIEKLETKNIFLSFDNVKVNSLGTGYSSSFVGNTGVNVAVRGKAEDLENLTVSKLNASVNLTGLGSGEYSIVIAFAPTGSLEVVGNYRASVVISDKKSGNDDE